MKFKSPDLNAPRFRKKRISLFTRAFFTQIREEHPQLKSISDKDIRIIVEAFNTELWESVLQNRYGVELPEQLGVIFIGACEPKTGANPDYRTSIALSKGVSHHNLGSEAFVAKIFYSTFATKYRFRNHELWGFEGCRKFTRGCSAEFRQNYTRFIQVDKNIKISSLFRTKPMIDKTEQIPMSLEDYNEFDL